MKILQKFFTPRPFVPYQIFKEEGLRELVENFYKVMETDPKAKECLEVHELVNGKVEEHVKEKLFDFLSGWMGGPQLFMQKHGAPRMRARHMHVKISEKEKEQWLYCMEKALSMSSAKIKRKHKKIMLNSFTALAMRIQNI
ncbi:MAG: hemoglobin-like oxygen-binding protein [Halobacteriovoraceae bacterium]|nr:hemoglobin-like oxygen-binding protein [Halobacteriovoraceae bacterium]|tara:strand:- start:147937 stop:148359 length:423 start_codon:yes stop_codon:yes gene_type:complete